MYCPVFICCTTVLTCCHSLPFFVTLCHSFSLFVTLCTTCCHSLSLVVPLVVIRCYSLYHSLSFVVTRCATRCHSLSLDVPLVCLFISDLSKLTFQPHLHKMYMAFYLLKWTYFNDVNMGRNILINSQLERTLFMSSMKQNWEREKKHGKRKQHRWEWLHIKLDTRFKFIESFWIWTKNKNQRYQQ